ncbi:MAG: PilZ domain-containing protein [Vicinamibacterales bacterium]
MTKEIPDLVLTSPFLGPSDEAALTAYLKQLPAASHVLVITLPYSIDSGDASNQPASTKALSFLRRRSALAPPACDPSTVREQIEEYLAQARAIRAIPPAQPETGLILRATPEVSGVATTGGRRTHLLGGGQVSDRRRARRRTAAELPWLWTVKLPSGAEAKLVDISSSGVLIETISKITPGSTFDLQVLGQDTNLRVPARMVRSEVGSVDRLGVRYRAAATFARDLDILGPRPPSSSSAATLMPKVLADLLSRVLAEVDCGSGSATLRARFEQELRRLLPVRDIQIRQTPVITNEGTESIYFTVPRASGSRPILQAIFEPNYQPSAMEFRVLKAAASVAAVVLEFAPLSEEAQALTAGVTASV